MIWSGVMPAMTTPFDSNFAAWLLENGCTGLVALGSLGEGATLEHAEKIAILKTAVRASEAKKTPVVAAVSALSTKAATQIAMEAEDAGCNALMVLPPYIYATDWREMKAHVSTVIAATNLPCMLYNNPISYTTDFTPAQIAELAAEHSNFEAVKESSSDVRRIMAIREVLDDRISIFVGVDDIIVESIGVGAVGWIAGLVNAFPAESVELFNLAAAGNRDAAFALYRWFLPLLRLDTVPKLVQYIKWVQAQTGTGSATVRAPRLELVGDELAEAQAILKTALTSRPEVRSTPLLGL
jgi:1-pyrroline-4-hydroxy-2-carboxylate deaminase